MLFDCRELEEKPFLDSNCVLPCESANTSKPDVVLDKCESEHFSCLIDIPSDVVKRSETLDINSIEDPLLFECKETNDVLKNNETDYGLFEEMEFKLHPFGYLEIEKCKGEIYQDTFDRKHVNIPYGGQLNLIVRKGYPNIEYYVNDIIFLLDKKRISDGFFPSFLVNCSDRGTGWDLHAETTFIFFWEALERISLDWTLANVVCRKHVCFQSRRKDFCSSA
jgi:hypothetical protein